MDNKIFTTFLPESFLIGIGENIPDTIHIETISKKLNSNPEFSNIEIILETHDKEDINQSFYYWNLKYDGNIYTFATRIYHNLNYEVKHFCHKIQYLNKEDKEFLKKADKGIEVLMFFTENIKECYKLQFKILDTIYPNYKMVADFSSLRIFNRYWIKSIVNGDIELNNSHLYSIHLVEDSETDKIWLHSHGLLRNGIRDIQMYSTKEDMKKYYNIMSFFIESILNNTIYSFTQGKQMETAYNIPLTLKESDEHTNLCENQIDYHLDLKLYINDNLSREINEYIDFNNISSLKFVSLEDTFNMRNNALKIFSKFEEYYDKYPGIIKFAIPYDLNFDTLTFEKAEYMWFSKIKIKENEEFEGILMNKPEIIKDLKIGTKLTLPKKALVDWGFIIDDLTIYSDEYFILKYIEESKTNKFNFFRKLKNLFIN